jgi:hypothetical protein
MINQYMIKGHTKSMLKFSRRINEVTKNTQKTPIFYESPLNISIAVYNIKRHIF